MFGLAMPRRSFTAANVSSYVPPSLHMRYEMTTEQDLDTPCEQCTRTRPFDVTAASSMKSKQSYRTGEMSSSGVSCSHMVLYTKSGSK